MERSHAQENLAQLVNIETLLGKLSRSPERPPTANVKASPALPRELAAAVVEWPREVLSLKLCERLSAQSRANAEQSGSGFMSQPAPALVEHIHLHRLVQPARTVKTSDETLAKLDRLFELLTVDVLAARDRLLMLNPGRRKMIERRLEFIGRKIARSRGERLNRSLSLPEILKESYRDSVPGAPVTASPKLGIAAWRGFVSEVALYNLLELFFLKGLDVYGWRNFEPADLGRMNFSAHTFLSQRAAGFAHDKHCWNFVRTNLYSWYVPSQKALVELAKVLEELRTANFTWSDHDLSHWVAELPTGLKLQHMEFADDARTAGMLADLLETQLNMPLTSKFQGRAVCRKFFVPALELGGVALSLLDRLLLQIRQSAPNAFEGGVADESSQLHRAVWACEGESFEVFWTEVLALLKILRSARSTSDYAGLNSPHANSVSLSRLPHAMHVVNSLGLELHNMDQLPLGGPEVSKLQQGSAAQIQQLEAFDVAIVTDHPDRAKSAAWMKALAQQLPYWRGLVGTGTNLNWGELHLHLAATKLKENGLCIYLSHRALPEGGDGEKLRKSVLNLCTLDYFLELPEDAHRAAGTTFSCVGPRR
ncbi:MAG: hypothetical protein HY074_12880 [Deltaproteobacteria bacterium]|nr:hypothetical protein [Deltaproteobacteria bacterium]